MSFGNLDCPPIQVNDDQRNQLTKFEQSCRRYNQRGIPVTFEIGERVLLRANRAISVVDQCIRKFFLLYEGPYKLLKSNVVMPMCLLTQRQT